MEQGSRAPEGSTSILLPRARQAGKQGTMPKHLEVVNVKVCCLPLSMHDHYPPSLRTPGVADNPVLLAVFNAPADNGDDVVDGGIGGVLVVDTALQSAALFWTAG